MSDLLKLLRFVWSGCGISTLVVWLTCAEVRATQPPTAEFDIPYQVRVLPNAAILEVSGSFSWALPQNLEAMLAGAPQVRVVRLESPGGHLLAALQVAAIIQQRGLDTYVGRFCASACTIAFLGGRQRWLAPDARLGFHQAYAPGFSAEQANAFLRTAYEKFAVPSAFVAHVLRTPHTAVWYPTQDELRAVHYTTGAPPASVALVHGSDVWHRAEGVDGPPHPEADAQADELASLRSEPWTRSPDIGFTDAAIVAPTKRDGY